MKVEDERFRNIELEGRIEDAFMIPLEAMELMHRGAVDVWDFWRSCFACMAGQWRSVTRAPQRDARSD